MLLQLEDDYRWVLFVASLIGFHCTITGFFAGSRRKHVFSEAFMEKNFKAEHERFFPGQKVPKGGFPDMGNGRYAEKLSYKDWFEFNVGQRIHYNYLECIACVVVWLLVGGLAYNWVATGFGAGFLGGRILYHIGYSMKGPSGRGIGFVL